MPVDKRPTIGIVSGSGPEAGIDLLAKVLRHNQDLLGSEFAGDLDAPRVVLISEPLLGRSMDLERYENEVWEALRSTVEAMDPHVDTYAIACNTLNWFEPQLRQLGTQASFVSFQSVVLAWLKQNSCAEVGLLGAAPVTDMGEWSAYRSVADQVRVETPANSESLHQLIYDVKRVGSSDPAHRRRFESLLSDMSADTVLLACTELPLLGEVETDKTLVDVTDLVAFELATRSLQCRGNAD